MLKVIKKNTFDLNSQQSKTEIILEHMADGVMAFSTTKEIVHMNKSAMRMLNITNEDENFDTICQKLSLNIDFQYNLIVFGMIANQVHSFYLHQP